MAENLEQKIEFYNKTIEIMPNLSEAHYNLGLALGEKGDLDASIANLVKKGLTIKIQQALDIVRVIGNNAVHPGQIDLKDNRDTALQLFNLINIIANVMISEPKEVEKLYQSLPKGAKDAIERRDR